MTGPWVDVRSIASYFESLLHPRHSRNRRHLLIDIVVIAVCALVCGCDGSAAIGRELACFAVLFFSLAASPSKPQHA
jgi:hypothetical protein